jgi:excisionase family DNA binding protein
MPFVSARASLPDQSGFPELIKGAWNIGVFIRGNGMESKTQQERPVRGQLLTAKEAAKYLHMSLTTLYYGVKTGKIDFFHPPVGKILFDTADLDHYLRKSKVSAGTVLGDI